MKSVITDMQHPSLIPHKELNSLIHRTLFCVNVYRNYQILKTATFLAHPVLFTDAIHPVLYNSEELQYSTVRDQH